MFCFRSPDVVVEERNSESTGAAETCPEKPSGDPVKFLKDKLQDITSQLQGQGQGSLWLRVLVASEWCTKISAVNFPLVFSKQYTSYSFECKRLF